MPRFSIRNPYFIIVCCLAIAVIGVLSFTQMPVDLFPPINLPEVVVATFYSGMPPEDIETDITNPLERFFTLASGVDHSESRSLLGVSMIKVFFQPGTSADADVTQLSNLALADLKRLPPGTLPPVVLKFDASSLPVCLVTVKGEGLNETQLHDLAQFQIRNQIAVVKGAEIPGVFGGKYRQAMIYVDPFKLLSRQLSVMDVVNAVNDSNLILPAGDVKIGPNDYYVYSNSLVKNVKDLNDLPLKTVGNKWVSVGDVGEAEGRQPVAVQHRPHRRPEIRLHPHHEAGRRHQHHSGGGRRPEPHQQSFRPSRAVEDRHRIRPVGVREAGPEDRAPRRHDGAGADQPHDPDLSGKHAGHFRGAVVHPDFRPGHIRGALPDGQHDQHHDSGRPGPGFLPRHR